MLIVLLLYLIMQMTPVELLFVLISWDRSVGEEDEMGGPCSKNGGEEERV
jgi:hypothetical protein